VIKEYLSFNRNLLIAFAAALSASAVVSQLVSDMPAAVNSLVSLATDTGIFFLVFGILFYRQHKGEFVDQSTSKADFGKIKWILVRLGSTLSVAEIEYNLVKPYAHFFFLEQGYEPYVASVIASLITFAGYIAIADVMAHYTKLLKKK
jgi:hypothetical protein